MFIIKKKYYLYIENTSDINLKCIKKSKKIFIIYRNKSIKENIDKLYKFRKLCAERGSGHCRQQ